MGTIKRLNEAKQKLADAENAMPGAYESRYSEGIENALTAMGQKNEQGFSFDSGNKDYRGALSRLFGNAGAGAEAAAQVAQQLSGGYGADWADTAADQAAAAQTGSTAGAMANARADALAQWQRELAGQSDQLSTLLGQDSLERTEYDGKVSNAQDWRSYLYGRSEQARQENRDFWGNVWNVVKGLGSAALQGYDAYKGYRQQDWENAFALRQYNDNLSRTQLSDQMAALQQAAAYKQAGFNDAATQVLAKYGMDSTMLDAWQGISQVDQDKLGYLTTAAGLAGSGYDTAAKNYLQMAGLDAGSIDYSPVLNQRKLNYNVASQNALRAAKAATTGSGTGSRSTGTGSSAGKNSSGFTNSQLMTMANKLSGMKETDPLYGYYKQTLTDAGWLTGDNTGSGVATQSGTGSRAAVTTSRLPTNQRTPWKTYGSTGTAGTDAVAGASGKVGGAAGGDFDAAIARAQSMANSGYSMSQIAEYLIRMGYSDNTISRVSNVMGW